MYDFFDELKNVSNKKKEEVKINFTLFKEKMKIIKLTLKRFEEAAAALKVLSGNYIEDMVGETLIDEYIKLLSLLFNDKNDWISYFVFDCSFGKTPMTVYVEGKQFKLNSIERLWGIING